jgi:putative ABC transport system permease protein
MRLPDADMKTLKQVRAVVVMNLLSLPQRVATSVVVVVGIAGVVAVLISVLSLSTGLSKTLASTGHPRHAIVLSAGAQSEIGSSLARDAVSAILSAQGIARTEQGTPIASADMLTSVRVARRETSAAGSASFRGVAAEAFALRPQIKLVGGRMFESGLRELIVGRAAQIRFANLDVGDTITFGADAWNVVGVFTSGGDAFESELITDATTLMSAYYRTAPNSVTVRLESPQSFDAFKAALTTNPALTVDVKRESEYYQQQSRLFARFLSLVANIVATVMGIGAVFAALNTMYSSVSARTNEIATLRALGFGSIAVVASVLVEALLLALIGALLGASIAWLLFNGNTVSTLSGGSGMSQVIFHLRIGWSLVSAGIIWACVIGIIGGLLPAIRAGRLPVATALRAV